MSDSCDFPAAHSMDTTWFAVDQDGNVAIFSSGESGAVPKAAIGHDEGMPAEEVLEEVPEGSLFMYEHTTENWISGPYERTTVPVRPVKADDVPDELLENAIRFEGRFAETETLQPASLWRCESWQPGWLAMDQTTVRPFAGREAELEEMREDLLRCADDRDLVFLPEAADVEVDAERFSPPAPETRDKKPWWKLW